MENIKYALIIALTFHFVFNVDYTLGWQTMIRPIVTAPIMGLILGDMRTGIIMGASLEAIYMGISPIGGSVPSDPTAAAVLAVAFVVIGGSDIETALALSLPIGTAAASVNSLTAPVHVYFSTYFEKLAAEGKDRKFALLHVIYNFTIRRGAVTIVIFLAVAFGIDKVNQVLGLLPAFIQKGLSAAGGMLPAVGFGILISMIWTKKLGAYFFLGFVMVVYMKLPTLAIALVGSVIAIVELFRDIDLNEMKKQRQTPHAAVNDDDKEDFFA